MNRIVSSLLVAALVVLAGCAGGIAGPGDSGSQSADSGTVQFYVSDQPNAIENFEHLNVTITEVGFAAADTEANASADASANASVDAEANANSSADAEAEAEADANGDAWVEHEVDSRTVDLTELQGANATVLGNLSVPAGEYEQVFVRVSDVDGTLKSGEEADVKLPSGKLKLNEGFEVDGESDVEFVFDVTVFEAGNSGKHVLKPVASESGTDVPIVDVDRDGDGDLEVSVLGNATAGENATVEVTRGGEAVSNATVEVDDGATVTTNADGTATVEVPADDEFEVKASVGGDGDARAEGEAELELELGAGDDGDGSNSDDSDTEDGDSSDGNTEVRNATADLAVVLEGTFASGEEVTVVATDGDGNQVSGAEVRVDGEVVGETDDDGELAFELSSDVSMGSQVTVEGNGATVTVDSSTVAAAN